MTEIPLTYETYRDITDQAQWGAMAQAITLCFTKSFGHEMPADEVKDALTGSLIVLAKTGVTGSDNLVVGYSSLHRKKVAGFKHLGLEPYDPETLRFSLGAGTVIKELQGRGIYRELNRKRLGQVVMERSPLLTTTTQNPRVEHGIRQVLDEFASQGLLKNYTVSREFLPAFYGRRLTHTPLEVFGTSFAELNIEAGDCFSLIFALSYWE